MLCFVLPDKTADHWLIVKRISNNLYAKHNLMKASKEQVQKQYFVLK